jgi:hypothetical protein
MTEEEWLAAADVKAMVSLPAVASNLRKLRLFGVACARELLIGLDSTPVHAPWNKSPRLLKGLDAAERYADGRIKPATLRRWFNEVYRVVQTRVPLYPERGAPDPQWLASVAAQYTTFDTNIHVAWAGAIEIILSRPEHHYGTWGSGLHERLSGLVHDIFGNPFRPVTFDPDWQTSTVVALARQMYDSRDFSPIPILADALQDAGCDHADILDHCRGLGPHVRGCWVVDLVLGKV